METDAVLVFPTIAVVVAATMTVAIHGFQAQVQAAAGYGLLSFSSAAATITTAAASQSTGVLHRTPFEYEAYSKDYFHKIHQ